MESGDENISSQETHAKLLEKIIPLENSVSRMERIMRETEKKIKCLGVLPNTSSSEVNLTNCGGICTFEGSFLNQDLNIFSKIDKDQQERSTEAVSTYSGGIHEAGNVLIQTLTNEPSQVCAKGIVDSSTDLAQMEKAQSSYDRNDLQMENKLKTDDSEGSEVNSFKHCNEPSFNNICSEADKVTSSTDTEVVEVTSSNGTEPASCFNGNELDETVFYDVEEGIDSNDDTEKINSSDYETEAGSSDNIVLELYKNDELTHSFDNDTETKTDVLQSIKIEHSCSAIGNKLNMSDPNENLKQFTENKLKQIDIGNPETELYFIKQCNKLSQIEEIQPGGVTEIEKKQGNVAVELEEVQETNIAGEKVHAALINGKEDSQTGVISELEIASCGVVYVEENSLCADVERNDFLSSTSNDLVACTSLKGGETVAPMAVMSETIQAFSSAVEMGEAIEKVTESKPDDKLLLTTEESKEADSAAGDDKREEARAVAVDGPRCEKSRKDDAPEDCNEKRKVSSDVSEGIVSEKETIVDREEVVCEKGIIVPSNDAKSVINGIGNTVLSVNSEKVIDQLGTTVSPDDTKEVNGVIGTTVPSVDSREVIDLLGTTVSPDDSKEVNCVIGTTVFPDDSKEVIDQLRTTVPPDDSEEVNSVIGTTVSSDDSKEVIELLGTTVSPDDSKEVNGVIGTIVPSIDSKEVIDQLGTTDTLDVREEAVGENGAIYRINTDVALHAPSINLNSSFDSPNTEVEETARIIEIAVTEGNYNLVDSFVKSGAKVTLTAIIEAVKRDFKAIFDLLFGTGVIETVVQAREVLLEATSSYVAGAIIKKWPDAVKGEASYNLLLAARNKEVLSAFINGGGKLNTDAALRLILRDGNSDYLSMFLNHINNVNRVICCGQTALHLAAEYNDSDCISVLLKHGADVNCTDRFGNSPIQRAAAFDCKEAIKVLNDAGAICNPIQKSTFLMKCCPNLRRNKNITAIGNSS